jgi:hypothetical protein
MVNRLSQVKEDSFSEQVDALAKSDDTQITGFPFFQLGHLEYFPRDPKHLSQNDLFSEEWEDAGFGVGIRLSSTGGHEGVYIFFNFQPQNDEDERWQWSGNGWGYLPVNKDQQIACARIADSVDELQHGKRFGLSEVYSMVPKYVRVIRSMDDRLRKPG